MRYLCAALLLLVGCADPTELPAPVEEDMAPAEPSCTDGRLNGSETDEDCGGPDCAPCGVAQNCSGPADCDSGVCNGECVAATCRDGVLNGSEVAVDCGGPACPACEDTGADAGSAECGNGLVEDGEDCDDQNDDDTDDCIDCIAAACGDGLVQAGVEACDDGNDDDTDDCVACQIARCGDGALQAGIEVCDDRNDVDTDDCVACQAARCGDGSVHAGVEDCDDQNDDDTDDCIACAAARCGDGFVHAGVEDCDDQNDDDTDDCIACVAARCGDGFVRAGQEECDTGTASASCDADCTAAVCGDGVVNVAAGEQCEAVSGCGTDCRWEPVTYVVASKSELIGLTSDCSTTDTFPHLCALAQTYGFAWMDATPYAPSAVQVEFSTGNYCSTSRTKNTQLNGFASGQFVLASAPCACESPSPPLNTWSLFNVQNYRPGLLNSFTMTTQNGCEGIALTNGQFYARVTLTP